MKKDKNLVRIILSAILFSILTILNIALYFPTINNINIIALIGYLLIYILIGIDVVIKAIKNISHGQVFDENFLMLVASIGAFIIGEYAESVVVILLYQIGEYFQNKAVAKSRKSISALMDIKALYANIIRDDKEYQIAPEDIVVGDIIRVKKGEKVPVDCVVMSGASQIDAKALTGESNYIEVGEGEEVLSGSINEGNVLLLEAKKEYYDSTVSKILDLVENVAGKKSKQENFITKFARVYTPIVCILAVIIAVIPSLVTSNWQQWIIRALTFLVVSCPCALVISVPLSFFGAIGGAGKFGILVKGGSYLEKISKLDTVVFDKTGTLTYGTFEVTEVFPKENREEILNSLYIAESGSNHPIAKSIMKNANINVGNGYEIKEIEGFGILAKNEKDIILVGSSQLMERNEIFAEKCDNVGTIIHIAKNDKYLGYVVISDVIKGEAKEVIDELNNANINTVMLSGDNEKIVSKVANTLGIREYHSKVLPKDKVTYLEKIMNKSKGTVAFVGDGINDAPVLMTSDVGISMGNVGSDSAIEASSVVLMHDNLKGINTIRKIAKKTIKIVNQNIVFALLIKIAVLILSSFGFVSMWIAVFADVGVSIIAIINAMRCMKIKE